MERPVTQCGIVNARRVARHGVGANRGVLAAVGVRMEGVVSIRSVVLACIRCQSAFAGCRVLARAKLPIQSARDRIKIPVTAEIFIGLYGSTDWFG